MDFDKVYASRSPKISTKNTPSIPFPSHSFLITIYQHAERGVTNSNKTPPLRIHNRSQSLIFAHQRWLLAMHELDELRQLLTGGVFELVCGGRHDFGQDGKDLGG